MLSELRVCLLYNRHFGRGQKPKHLVTGLEGLSVAATEFLYNRTIRGTIGMNGDLGGAK